MTNWNWRDLLIIFFVLNSNQFSNESFLHFFHTGRCEKLVVRAKKVKGGGRQLKYNWDVAWSDSNTNTPTLVQRLSLTDINRLSHIASKLVLTATQLTSNLMDENLNVTVQITNFLGLTRSVSVNVRRENRDFPQLFLVKKNIVVKASKKVVLQGKIFYSVNQFW